MRLWINVFQRLVALAAIATGLAAPAIAHHSFAAFNMEQTITVSGTVKEFEWTNPHCWLVLQIPAADGSSSEWRFEGAPPIMLSRGGWTEDSLHPGDRVTLTYHPRRDGAHGGSFQSVTLPDGRSIGSGGSPGGPPPGGSGPPPAGSAP